MREFSWSPAEKKIARAAYDLAYQRECDAIRREVESMLRNDPGSQIVWRLEEYLRDRRQEIDRKYDYRYSVLMFLFMRLYHESLIGDDDLRGLSQDKIELITRGPVR